MAELDVKKGPNGYNVAFPNGGNVTVLPPSITNNSQITLMTMRYPNGTTVTVKQGLDDKGRLDPNQRAGIRIEGAGVTPDLAAQNATAILSSENFLKTLTDNGRITEGIPGTEPVGSARANALGFAAQIHAGDAVIVPKRTPAATP